MRILLVEDDPALVAGLRRALGVSGYVVEIVRDADDAFARLEQEVADLVVVGSGPRGQHEGMRAFCRRLRETGAGVPVLVLTPTADPAMTVAALDAGADDVIAAPVHLDELRARIRALLRRTPQTLPTTLHAGSVVLDPASRTAERDGRRIELTAKEYAVLEYLMRRPGTVVSVLELIDHAWERDAEGYSNVVPTYIRYVRRKLAVDGLPDPIRTHRGVGYSIATSA